jgi:hypothetical protein
MAEPTLHRVPRHTDPEINARINDEARKRIAQALAADGVEARLAELDREWDTERVLQTNFAVLVLAGLALGAFADRRWFALPAAAAGFMVQHALQGWCPPLALFRRRGYRDPHEIERERHALKALRGELGQP